MKENQRKCFKCGSSPAEDPDVVLCRFPNPGKKNFQRCELWAKYCFPSGAWSSPDFQKKLFSEHRMLCHKHFKQTSFIDYAQKKLHRHAAPCNECDEIVSVSILDSVRPQPQAGPSQEMQPFMDISNIVPCSSTHAAPIPQKATIQVQQQNKKPKLSQPAVKIANPESTARKTEASKLLYIKCRKYMKRICQLRNRIKKMKTKQTLQEINEDDSVKNLMKRITPTFALLLQGQIKNYRKKARGRRWSLDNKIVSLQMYKKSPTCYRLLRRLFCLPSPSTLKKLLGQFNLKPGINDKLFSMMSQYTSTQKPSDNEYVLTFDEMSIKKHLEYNKKDDLIQGFQDHGEKHGRTAEEASHALVFMVCGIRKKVEQPVAFYLSGSHVTADRLAVLIKEVLRECFNAGLNVSATVCDMDGVNRRALGILGASEERPSITISNKEIVTLFDPPHLLKCFRNLFMKYDINCSMNISSKGKSGKGIAKWSHITKFYELDSANHRVLFL